MLDCTNRNQDLDYAEKQSWPVGLLSCAQVRWACLSPLWLCCLALDLLERWVGWGSSASERCHAGSLGVERFLASVNLVAWYVEECWSNSSCAMGRISRAYLQIQGAGRPRTGSLAFVEISNGGHGVHMFLDWTFCNYIDTKSLFEFPVGSGRMTVIGMRLRHSSAYKNNANLLSPLSH